MPVMDVATFLGLPQQRVNVMSMNVMDRNHLPTMKKRIVEIIESLPKMTYSIKKVLGDYYYTQMSVEQAMKMVIHEIPKSKKLQT